jgi:putative glutathione S-transferase
VAETVNMDHIKRSYYRARPHMNPLGIVPVGPELSYDAPHDRGRFGRG